VHVDTDGPVEEVHAGDGGHLGVVLWGRDDQLDGEEPVLRGDSEGEGPGGDQTEREGDETEGSGSTLRHFLGWRRRWVIRQTF